MRMRSSKKRGAAPSCSRARPNSERSPFASPAAPTADLASSPFRTQANGITSVKARVWDRKAHRSAHSPAEKGAKVGGENALAVVFFFKQRSVERELAARPLSRALLQIKPTPTAIPT